MYYFTDEELYKRVGEVKELAIEEISKNKELDRLCYKIHQDEMLYLHSKKVAELATGIGLAYKLDRRSILELCIGAYLHDVGKIKLDAAVLYKKGIFTDDERSYAQTHTTIGKALLEDIGVSDRIIEIAECHHKKLDGTGYPGPIDVDDIPLYAQIVTVADMFEAMTSDRCYRTAMDEEKVFKMLWKDKGINQIAVRILKQNITTVKAKIYMYGGAKTQKEENSKVIKMA